MVGSAIVRELQRRGYTNLLTRTHSQLDLCRQADVEEFFASERPEYVFLAAARVGGILANEQALADFMYDNLALEMNVIHAAYEYGCKKLEFLGSSCIYPRMAPQPMTDSTPGSGLPRYLACTTPCPPAVRMVVRLVAPRMATGEPLRISLSTTRFPWLKG